MAAAELDSMLLAQGGIIADQQARVPQAYRFCRPHVLHFGDPESELKAALQNAALFDVSDRTQIELAGSDCKSFLNNLCTNDTKRLAAGQGCEAFLTNVKGRILAHVFVFVDDGSLVVETMPHVEETLLAHLDRYLIREDVILTGQSQDWGELLVSGPAATGLLASLGAESESLATCGHVPMDRAGTTVRVRRVDWLGDPGYLLAAQRQHLAGLWAAARDAGFQPAGAAAFHAARIAARFPLHGLDISEENLAPEAGRSSQAISFTKGCYLGQEPIARIDAVGHINRELCLLQFASDRVPATNDAILSDDGNKIGHVTSSAPIPGEQQGVALGILKRAFVAAGTRVRIQCSDEGSPGHVAVHEAIVNGQWGMGSLEL